MNIGQREIAAIMAHRKAGRPRIGSWRLSFTVPDEITIELDERRRITNESRRHALLAIIDDGIKHSRSTHWLDRQGAIDLLKASITARLKATEDKDAKRIALNALMALDGIEEYLKSQE